MSSKKLTDNAMLVRLHIRQWTASKSSNVLNKEAEKRHGTASGAVASYKKLMQSDPLDNFRRYASEASQIHKFHTLPWMDDGVRILPVAAFDDYTENYRKVRDKADGAIRDIIDTWPEELEHAKKRMGDLFNPADYPTQAVIRQKFQLDMSFWPIPDAGDWRVELGDERDAEVRENIESRLQVVQEAAMQDLWKRVYECVEHVHEILAKPNGVIRNSLMDNAVKLVGVLDKLNVTEDPELDKLREEIRLGVVNSSTDTLRNDDNIRIQTARRAKEILGKMEAYNSQLAA